MTNQVVVQSQSDNAIEAAVAKGDLALMTPIERVQYYKMLCESLGLNPLTKPFEYMTLQGKLTLYPNKGGSEQLRNVRKVSINIIAREVVEGTYVVTARAKTPDGREDEAIGAVPIDNVKGEARANAMMKAETKAKRRVTLSMLGLNFSDESEVDSIPGAQRITEKDALAIPAKSETVAVPKQADASLEVLPPEGETFENAAPINAFTNAQAAVEGKSKADRLREAMAKTGLWSDVMVREYMMKHYKTSKLSEFTEFQFKALITVVSDVPETKATHG